MNKPITIICTTTDLSSIPAEQMEAIFVPSVNKSIYKSSEMIPQSNCCDATIINQTMCSKCFEHCEPIRDN